jgi:hypothetical protein
MISNCNSTQEFYSAHFNPYLNYHSPGAQADIEIDEKGRQQRIYRRYQTPLETLLAVHQSQQYLRPGPHSGRLATHRRNPHLPPVCSSYKHLGH